MKNLVNVALFFALTFLTIVAAGFVARLYWSMFMLGWSLL